MGLRNAGNQWVTSFPSATIEIQIVGRTHEWVEDTQAAVLSRIVGVTKGQQEALVTRPGDRITADVEPLSMQISPVNPSRVSQALAIAAMGVAAAILGTWAAVVTDQLSIRRRNDSSVRRHTVLTPGLKSRRT